MPTGLAPDQEPARTSSTSPALSSPPKSPDSPHHAIAWQAAPSGSTVAYADAADEDVIKVEGDARSEVAARAANAKGSSATPSVKKPRKKRESATNTGNSTATEAKEKKTRKPRAVSSTAIAGRRKAKVDPAADPNAVAAQASRHPKITEAVAPPPPPPDSRVLASTYTSQSGNSEAITNDPVSLPPATAATQPTTRSGQNYDPIRSSAFEAPKPFTSPYGPQQPSPLKSTNRASESPSISSLIDPPSAPSVTYPVAQTSNPPSFSNPSPSLHHDYNPQSRPQLSPPVPIYGDMRPRQSTSTSPSSINLLSTRPQPPPYPKHSPPSTAMDIDTEPLHPSSNDQLLPSTTKPPQQSSRKTSTGTSTPSSATHSPKPPRPKDKDALVPPLPSGNGLLSSTLFGGPADPSVAEKLQAPTVILHVPLNGEGNKYVNFARMAEERYGFNALHPRLAAQRDRLARVAAASALLEKVSSNGGGLSGSGGASADEMSVELSDGDGDGDNSNIEMGGMDTDAAKEATTVKPKLKRKMKEDNYDKDDPFVDDSELAWEEQAAASKDGFFVYSGPLVPAGEKPQVERADGTPKVGRGRGRGRGGRGSRGGRGGANHDRAIEGTAGDSGAGPKTRGTGVTRKPRVKKADRAMREAEKADREKMAVLVAKPPGYVGVGMGVIGGT
ncbi:hypothetical protein MMC26_005074 [Xylographa opegraphella]|nr:hypothetical protein [Xylographa opegraphella]